MSYIADWIGLFMGFLPGPEPFEASLQQAKQTCVPIPKDE